MNSHCGDILGLALAAVDGAGCEGPAASDIVWNAMRFVTWWEIFLRYFFVMKSKRTNIRCKYVYIRSVTRGSFYVFVIRRKNYSQIFANICDDSASNIAKIKYFLRFCLLFIAKKFFAKTTQFAQIFNMGHLNSYRRSKFLSSFFDFALRCSLP